jgi:outer membrane murein-binding lipoprotein Lpp
LKKSPVKARVDKMSLLKLNLGEPMKSVVRFAALAAVLVVSLMTGACSSQKRMESATGRVEDLNGPVSPEGNVRVARKAVVELTAEQEKALQNELLALPEGLLNFDTPPALRRGSPVRLEARVSRDFVTKLNEALEKQPLLSGVRVKDMLGLGLAAGSMTVKPLSSVEQKVGEAESTTWAWEVTPSTLGRFALTLNLTMHLRNESGQKQRAYPVVERYVEVQDAKGGFFATYGWWILAVLLVGAAVILLVKKP